MADFNSLNEAWEIYRTRFPECLSSGALQELKRCFFGGAAAAFALSANCESGKEVEAMLTKALGECEMVRAVTAGGNAESN